MEITPNKIETQHTNKRRALLVCLAPLAILLLFACCASVYRFLPGLGARPHWLTEKRQAMRRDSLQRVHAFVIASGKKSGKQIETDLAFLERELSDIPEGCH